jgi:hypothetical protein
MLDRHNREAQQLAQDLVTLAYDLAGERMNIVFRRYGVETKKYNPAQPRVPAKQRGAGQWDESSIQRRRSSPSSGSPCIGRSRRQP